MIASTSLLDDLLCDLFSPAGEDTVAFSNTCDLCLLVARLLFLLTQHNSLILRQGFGRELDERKLSSTRKIGGGGPLTPQLGWSLALSVSLLINELASLVAAPALFKWQQRPSPFSHPFHSLPLTTSHPSNIMRDTTSEQQIHPLGLSGADDDYDYDVYYFWPSISPYVVSPEDLEAFDQLEVRILGLHNHH